MSESPFPPACTPDVLEHVIERAVGDPVPTRIGDLLLLGFGAIGLAEDQLLDWAVEAREELDCWPAVGPAARVIRSRIEQAASASAQVAVRCGLAEGEMRSMAAWLSERRHPLLADPVRPRLVLGGTLLHLARLSTPIGLVDLPGGDHRELADDVLANVTVPLVQLAAAHS